MAKGKKPRKGDPSEEFVPVIYTRNLTEAEFYKGLLVNNDIPAIVEDEGGDAIGLPASIVGQGVAVLVPDEMLDEASEIIAEHEDAEEDKALEEHEDMNDEVDEDAAEDFEDDELDEDDAEDDEDVDDLDEDLDEDLEDTDDFDDEEDDDTP